MSNSVPVPKSLMIWYRRYGIGTKVMSFGIGTGTERHRYFPNFYLRYWYYPSTVPVPNQIFRYRYQEFKNFGIGTVLSSSVHLTMTSRIDESAVFFLPFPLPDLLLANEEAIRGASDGRNYERNTERRDEKNDRKNEQSSNLY